VGHPRVHHIAQHHRKEKLMAQWQVYRQWNPIMDGPAPKQGEEPNFRAKLTLIGIMDMTARVGVSPIKQARAIFGLRHPILHLLDRDGNPVKYDPEKEYQGS
jgi:hypothetical protein